MRNPVCLPLCFAGARFQARRIDSESKKIPGDKSVLVDWAMAGY
jgi:hypothetical protein